MVGRGNLKILHSSPKITDSNENHIDYCVTYRNAMLSHFESQLRITSQISPFLYVYKTSDYSAVVERTMTLGAVYKLIFGAKMRPGQIFKF